MYMRVVGAEERRDLFLIVLSVSFVPCIIKYHLLNPPVNAVAMVNK